MTDRPSMWSQVVKARWAHEVVCPKCGSLNLPGRKPTIELEDDGTASCAQCGHDWPASRPRAEPVG